MATEQAFAIPLSFGQQRLWFLHQLEPHMPVYNIPVAYRLMGELDSAAFEQSLNEVVKRHEALRTTFQTVDEQPMQVINPTLTVKLPVVDLQTLPSGEREAKVWRLAKEDAQCPFDLTRGPLLRACLLCIGAQEHVLLLNVHHIIFDDWSMGVLYRELSALYSTSIQGKAPSLPELSIQYADYAVWQREWLQGKVLELQLTYWRQQLAGAPAVLELPTDRPRPAVQTHHGSMYAFTLPIKVSQAISVLSRQEGVTLFMTLLTAFQVLLSRYTGQHDIVVGSPIANRNRVETEPLIGFFTNTLVLRIDLANNPSFRELLRRVREVATGAYAHQDLPFERLVNELQLKRDLSYSPLFQVMFTLQHTSTSDLKLAGLDVGLLEVGTATAKCDLSLTIATGNALTGVFEYSTDLFDEATIARMAGHFQTLLDGIITDPGQHLTDLPLLTPGERQQLLTEGNDTAKGYPNDVCVNQLFEEQVEKSLNAVAVILGEQVLTYRELNRRANQLAHHLQKLGVGPEVVVGICVERSLEMVVGLLGILKAGGAYIPLDPAYPKERLAFMLEDARVPVLLTQQRLVGRLPTHQADVVYLDTDWKTIAQERVGNPQSEVTTNNLAYVIYTSGSTGKPKGVMISHLALVNFLLFMGEQLSLTSQDVVFATTSLSFDIAGLELYLPLIRGAKVAVAPQGVTVDGGRLSAALDMHKSTMVQLTPAAWRMLLEVGWQGRQGLRMLCGGEVLVCELAHELLKKGSYLMNLYGPTETTIWSTLQKVEYTDHPIPLGHPIANTQVYVLDSYLEPVPIGIPGELYIGGSGLARGYLNRPELTAEKFIPHPFSEKPGRRLYRTGDLVRYESDHTIEFLGRTDSQVKVRGFRIELGEIEAVLREHPAVRDAVAVVRGDLPSDKRLAAYLIVNQELAPSVNELRGYLSARLPVYMVPPVLVFLDALPLTPNGKVDRKNLPAPNHSRPELERGYEAPHSPIEELLADIWAQVLDIEQVGIHDNFFELGGDSIRSVQIIARAKRVGLHLVPKQLFQHQTVEELVNDIMATESGAWQVKKIESILRKLKATANTN